MCTSVMSDLRVCSILPIFSQGGKQRRLGDLQALTSVGDYYATGCRRQDLDATSACQVTHFSLFALLFLSCAMVTTLDAG